MDGIKNEFIRGSAHVSAIRGEMREVEMDRPLAENRKRTHRKGSGELLRRRKRRRPKKRYMDAVKEDVEAAGVEIEDAGDVGTLDKKIHCGDS